MCYDRNFCNNVDIVESENAGFRATGYLSTLLLLDDASDAIFCWLLGPEVKAVAHNNTGPLSMVSWNFLNAPKADLLFIFL